eukprot:670094-Rhodomonas_salina.1
MHTPSLRLRGGAFALDRCQLVRVGLSAIADAGLAHDERLLLASTPDADGVAEPLGQDNHAEHVRWRVRQAELLDVLRLDVEAPRHSGGSSASAKAALKASCLLCCRRRVRTLAHTR